MSDDIFTQIGLDDEDRFNAENDIELMPTDPRDLNGIPADELDSEIELAQLDGFTYAEAKAMVLRRANVDTALTKHGMMAPDSVIAKVRDTRKLDDSAFILAPKDVKATSVSIMNRIRGIVTYAKTYPTGTYVLLGDHKNWFVCRIGLVEDDTFQHVVHVMKDKDGVHWMDAAKVRHSFSNRWESIIHAFADDEDAVVFIKQFESKIYRLQAIIEESDRIMLESMQSGDYQRARNISTAMNSTYDECIDHFRTLGVYNKMFDDN
jgi:hypothetical protein